VTKLTKPGRIVRTTSPVYNRPKRKVVPKCFRPDTVDDQPYKNILLIYYVPAPCGGGKGNLQGRAYHVMRTAF